MSKWSWHPPIASSGVQTIFRNRTSRIFPANSRTVVGSDTSWLLHFLVTVRRAFRLIAVPPQPKWCIASALWTIAGDIRRFAIAYKRMHLHYVLYFPQGDRYWRWSVIGCQLLPPELQRLFEHHSRLAKIIFLRPKDVFWKGELSDSSNLTKGRTFAETRHNPRLNHTVMFYDVRVMSFFFPAAEPSVSIKFRMKPREYHAQGYLKFMRMTVPYFV